MYSTRLQSDYKQLVNFHLYNQWTVRALIYIQGFLLKYRRTNDVISHRKSRYPSQQGETLLANHKLLLALH